MKRRGKKFFFTESKEVLVPNYFISDGKRASESSSLVFPSQLSRSHYTVADSMRRNNSSKIFNFTEVRATHEPLRDT